jgi:hypothetical protein
VGTRHHLREGNSGLPAGAATGTAGWSCPAGQYESLPFVVLVIVKLHAGEGIQRLPVHEDLESVLFEDFILGLRSFFYIQPV